MILRIFNRCSKRYTLMEWTPAKKKKNTSPLEETDIMQAEPETEVEIKPRRRPRKTEEPQPAWWQQSRYQVMAGLLLAGTGCLLAGSFASYLLTAGVDQSEVLINPINSTPIDIEPSRNTFGWLGAALGELFINRLFGLSAMVFPVILLTAGFNLMVRQPYFHLLKISLYSFFGLCWTSTAAAYLNQLILPDTAFAWGGAFGNYLSGSQGILIYWMKPAGTIALLLISGLIFAVWVYDFHFGFLLRWISPSPETPEVASPSTVRAPAPTSTDYRDESENIFAKDQVILSPATEPEEEEEEPDYPELIVSDETPADEDSGEEEDAYERNSQDMELEVMPVQEEPKAAEVHRTTTPYDPTLDLSHYEYPTVDLLEDYGNEKVRFDQEELERNKNQIIETLNNYSIEISKIKATIGPTVTLYEIVPAKGVRISKIKNLEDDIALSLSALGIRIIAPMPGKGTIGIEVPNTHKEIVSMRSLLASEKFQNTTADLPICIGKSISNEIHIADLAKMPHLLMAGATGQGKSVGINSILVSLLYKKHPSQLKFVLVDPKKVELSLYETLEKHFLAKLPGEEEAIITDTRKVVATLNSLCIEMDDRYNLLKAAGVRNLKEYNTKFINRQLNPQQGHRFMPYIVLVIDEFADLIMTAGKEVEMPIARLAQLARAIGIHLILATQRPSVNIITGTIKANFPARIAFKTSSKIDSRTILDTGGAEQLIGRGDLLLNVGSDIVRLQCGFVDTPEVERVRDFISRQMGYPEAFQLPEYIDPDGKGDDDVYVSGERDELFEEAARVIVQNQMGSTSLIQRRMKLGYNRAGRLMDQLQQAGIVGDNLGTKAREVKFKTEHELEEYLRQIRDNP